MKEKLLLKHRKGHIITKDTSGCPQNFGEFGNVQQVAELVAGGVQPEFCAMFESSLPGGNKHPQAGAIDEAGAGSIDFYMLEVLTGQLLAEVHGEFHGVRAANQIAFQADVKISERGFEG